MGEERSGGTSSIGALLEGERAQLLSGASEERVEQFHAAEGRRKVYEAWNTVCGGTREGSHVTGLYYAAESNRLVVYMDSPSWTQEMTMLREIIRARMELAGAKVDDIFIKTSRDGHRSSQKDFSRAPKQSSRDEQVEAPRVPLTPEELKKVDSLVSRIDDRKLRRALKNAMIASLERSKAEEHEKTP